MKSRLPSLRGLYACEAVARLGGLKLAAAELGVTPGAVSQLVRSIEADLEVPLFSRSEHGLIPCTSARAGLADLEEAIGILHGAVRKLRTPPPSALLAVSVDPAFATQWLVRRLGQFRLLNPTVDVLIDTTNQYVQLGAGPIDVAIRFGTAREPALSRTMLFQESVFPVCSPMLLAENGLARPEDVTRHMLIHLDWSSRQGAWPTWDDWLRAADVTGVAPTAGIRFSDHALALAAASRGDGVALGSTALVSDALAEGVLVRPFEISLATPFYYYAATLPDRQREPQIAAFLSWLTGEAEPTLSR